MAKVLVTENELKNLIKESVTKTIMEESWWNFNSNYQAAKDINGIKDERDNYQKQVESLEQEKKNLQGTINAYLQGMEKILNALSPNPEATQGQENLEENNLGIDLSWTKQPLPKINTNLSPYKVSAAKSKENDIQSTINTILGGIEQLKQEKDNLQANFETAIKRLNTANATIKQLKATNQTLIQQKNQAVLASKGTTMAPTTLGKPAPLTTPRATPAATQNTTPRVPPKKVSV